MIWGRRGCDEDRNYKVKIYFCDSGNPLLVAEQLTKKDAQEIYEKIRNELKTSKPRIFEVTTGKGNIVTVKKSNVTLVSVG